MRYGLLVGTAIVMAIASGQAHAQSGGANSADADEANTGDIVVTATRRSERLQDVPLAVTAVTGQTLADSGIKSLSDVQYTTPGLTVGDSPSDKGFRVRGVGSFTGTYVSGKENPVGVVVDGVVQGLGSSVNALSDIDHIEVLKGPQGTQFGKNASAGVINVVTAKPSTTGVSVRAYGSYATDQLYDVNGTVNLPLSSTAALRLNGYAKGYGDFVNNIATGKKLGANDEYGFRGKFLIEPADGVEVLISGDYSRQKINSGSQLWTVNASPVPQAGLTYGISNLTTSELRPGKQDAERWGLAFELNVDLGDYRLTSITAYREAEELDFGGFGQGFNLPFGPPGPGDWLNDSLNTKSQTTQELRVTSPRGGTVEFVAGYLFYDQPTTSSITGGPAFLGPWPSFMGPFPGSFWLGNSSNGLETTKITTQSHGLFADGKIRLSEATAILFGGRFTHDGVTGEFSNTAYNGGNLNLPFTPTALLPNNKVKLTADRFTWKLGLEHKLTDDVMLFGSASTGYLGPIINFRWTSGAADRILPQTNTNYTVGIKSQFLDRQITVNANLFYDKYRNFQTGYFDISQGTQFVAENAATLINKGAEVEFGAKLRSGINFGASLAYVHSRFGDYCSGGSAPTAATPACTAPAGFAGAQYRGLTPGGVPEFTANLYAGFETEVGSNLKASGNASYYYRSSSRNSPNDAGTTLKGYGIANLNFFLGSEDDSWRAGLYVRNLFDKKFASSVMSDPFGPPGTYINWVTRQSLRTIGGSVEFKF